MENTHAEAAKQESLGYAWLVVAILCFAGIVSYIDRQIINLLVGPIRADLGISDTQISLLQGFAFALFYAMLAIPLARLADVGNRKHVIVVGIFCWSFATLSCGFAVSFGALFAARMFVGVGEATLTPAGYSMISDYFPRDKVSAAISVFVGSSFLGSGVALLVGGTLIGWLNDIGPQTFGTLGTFKPWQMTFILVSLPSVILLGLMMLVREPIRRGSAGSSKPPESSSLAEVWAFLRENAAAITTIYAGFTLFAAAGYGVNTWTPAFLERSYGWEPQQVGAYFGPMVIIISVSGVIFGGWLCNWMIGKGWSDANLRMPMFAVACAIPFSIAFGFMPTGETALLCLAPVLFFGTMPFGAGTAALPLISPNRMRAQIVALYLLVANLVGYSLGPTGVALVTDYVFKDDKALGYSLSLLLPIQYTLGIIVIAFGLGSYRALLARQTAVETAD